MACESNYKFNSEKSSLYSYLTYGMFKQCHGYILNLPPAAGRRANRREMTRLAVYRLPPTKFHVEQLRPARNITTHTFS